jgi:nucleoside-diphosphate-sugar epimerase
MTTGVRLLVTGATGCVGRALVTAAALRGWQVRGLARGAAGPFPGELVQGSITEREAVRRAVDGCDAVVHLASWVHRVPRDEAELGRLRASIVGGSEHVAAAAREAGAKLIHASTVAVHGSGPLRGVDESTPCRPQSAYARAKLDSERIVLDRDPRAVILRLALIYGPHDRGNMRALIRGVDRGLAFVVGTGANPKSIAYVDNVADRILRALELDLTGVWIVADRPAPTQGELLDAIARALGRRRPLRVPGPVLEAAAGLVDRLCGTAYRERVSKLAVATEFLGDALDAALDYRPRVSLEQGMRQAVRWYREAGRA